MNTWWSAGCSMKAIGICFRSDLDEDCLGRRTVFLMFAGFRFGVAW